MNRWVPRSQKRRRKQRMKLLLTAVAGVLMILSIVKLANYYGQRDRDQKTTDEMKEALTTSTEEEPPAEKPAAAEGQKEGEKQEAAGKAGTPKTAAVAAEGTLGQIEYEENRSDRLAALKSRYRDLVGWLRIDGLIDEAVVQRDNEFYLDHDAAGIQNINGALFLDAIVDLQSRPYSLTIYGHNMRNGSKFGKLSRYEGKAFFSAHKRISFDTIYEDGTYEAFAAGVFTVDEPDIFFLNTLDVGERNRLIGKIRENAVIDSGIEVSGTDQILFLVTCVDDDAERRFVLAKRVE